MPFLQALVIPVIPGIIRIRGDADTAGYVLGAALLGPAPAPSASYLSWVQSCPPGHGPAPRR